MKILTILFFAFYFPLSLSAQFRKLSIEKAEVPSLKIVQIDFKESSTLVFFQFTNKDSLRWICAGENFFVRDRQTFKKYKLIESANIPICDKKHIFDKADEQLNFVLEFEKFDVSIGEFDIIENQQGEGFNFYQIKVDTSIRSEFLDIASFLEDNPVKEYSYFYKDGNPVLCYKHNGLFIAVLLTFDNNYGRFYQASILIQNFTGRDITFDPGQITCKTWQKEVATDAKVWSYNEYMKKVQNRQAWNSFAVSLGESMAAANAGYSSSTTHTAVSGSSNTNASAYGQIGNSYASAYGNSYTSASAYGSSTTQNYDGAAAYAARQQSSQNVASYNNRQYSVKRSLSEGYLKINTIENETEYQGYINMTYKKADVVQINIPINGTTYLFVR